MKQVVNLAVIFAASCCVADEGMWTLDQVPTAKIEEQYGIEVDSAWINRMRLSALRISSGGSGSFVSPDGLILTNHHVASSAIHSLATKDNDYMKEGFYAQELGDERKCANLHVDSLREICDITGEIYAQIEGVEGEAARERALREASISIKERVAKESGLHAEIVNLYQGAKIELYLYKRYTDVRLVMAPEKEVASFGGDTENFEYPRQCFDYAFLRAYENGTPVSTQNYISWSGSGAVGEEPLFVFGHPGSTSRMLPPCELIDRRDRIFPMILKFLDNRLESLEKYAARGQEQKRQALKLIARLKNFQKVIRGEHRSLQEEEIELGSEGRLAETLDATWDNRQNFFYTERVGFYGVSTYGFAKHFVRGSVELKKPSEKRLVEYCDSELETVKRALLSEEPIYTGVEVAMLEAGIASLVERFGADHPIIAEILSGPSAREIVQMTALTDVAHRKDLLAHPEKIAKSNDPMIELARLVDPLAREIRARDEAEFASVRRNCYREIVRNRGIPYPDATFTLRMSVGQMLGYQCEGKNLAPVSPLGEMFVTHLVKKKQAPYTLPAQWKSAKLDHKTPVNFVSTHDIIGGNSGSPVVNAKGELVGLIFDGNRYAFGWDYKFDQNQGRAISVHSSAILHSLERVYKANRLLEEIK